MSNKYVLSLTGSVPENVRRSAVQVPDEARGSGIRIVGGRGSGKSRLAGRLLCYQDYIRGVPQVVLDPVGGTANNLLDKLRRMQVPQKLQRWHSERIKWFDMGGQTGLDARVLPLGLLYRRGNESFYDQSQRYTNVIYRFDPSLTAAPIQGWNAFYPLATATGTILAAMGKQYTEAAHMVQHPELWEGQIRELAQANPYELQGVANFLLEDIAKAGRDKNSLTSAFLTKMRMLDWNPQSRAMFGASENALDFDEIVRKRQTVILDFRNEKNLEQRRFKLLWVFSQIMEYIYSRPAEHDQLPFAFVIDEIRYLLGDPTQHSGAIQNDLEELINQQMRNKSVWVTILHQELNQLHPSIRNVLMTMGIQCFGGTSDPDAALSVARRFHDWDPSLVRKYEPIYATSEGITSVIDYRSAEYSIEEQEYLHSRKHLKLPKFTYLVSVAKDEGSQPVGLDMMYLNALDPGIYPEGEAVDRIRQTLMARDGRRVRDVLDEIAGRTAPSRPGLVTSGTTLSSSSPSLVRRTPKRTTEQR